MNKPLSVQSIALSILGAAIGGCIGYFAFHWIWRQGFYAILIPPACLGLGAGYLARCRSQPLAIACGVAGLALVIFTEWRHAPFLADPSLLFLVTHIHQKAPIKLLLMGLGVFMCYRLALGMDRGAEEESRAGQD